MRCGAVQGGSVAVCVCCVWLSGCMHVCDCAWCVCVSCGVRALFVFVCVCVRVLCVLGWVGWLVCWLVGWFGLVWCGVGWFGGVLFGLVSWLVCCACV